MTLVPGTLLHNRYRIVQTLGSGGMGAVYRATDEHLLIPVAVKENLYMSEEYGRQFQREAHILAGLRHPHLPHVSDYFVIENQGQYLVMDYIEGEDLRQRMERMGPLPEREAMLIGISICDALMYLHTRRLPIIHRDIKPGNIKVTADGQAVLVDFGLAKIMQSDQKTSTGARAMTPGYSPPEQYGTARTDCRSDIYSLGATLYASLTGIIPEDGLDRMTGKARLIPMRELAPKINRRLAETIEKALEVEPDHRFQNAEEFKNALIESGELATYYQDRPTISPPPALVDESGASSVEEGAVNTGPKPSNQVSKRRRRTRTQWVALPSLAVTIIALILLIIFRSDVSRSVLGYFTASPPANSPTSVSAVNNTPPAQPSANPTATPSNSSSANGQVPQAKTTPTLTPTISLTPTITETSTPSATPRGGGIGQIAFTSDRSGSMEIWLLDLTTKKTHRITNQRSAGACQPTFSPDGMRMAFTSPCPNKQDNYQGSSIYAINLDAAGNPIEDSKIQLTFGLEGDFDPAWSPDGKRIAYTSLVNDKPSIFALDLQTQTAQDLSRSLYADRQPAWSPDGMSLAFVRQVATSRQIWTMSDNGELAKQFSPGGPTINAWPTWSPDGELIFYSQTPNSPNDAVPNLVYLRYEDRIKPKENRVPTNPKSDIGPVAQMRFSVDGFWLAFESWPDGGYHNIFMMSLSGSNRERLTTNPGKDFGPVWRPFAGDPVAAQP